MFKNRSLDKKYGKRKFPSEIGKVAGNNFGFIVNKKSRLSDMNFKNSSQNCVRVSEQCAPSKSNIKDTLIKNEKKLNTVTSSTPHVQMGVNEPTNQIQKYQDPSKSSASKLKIADENVDSTKINGSLKKKNIRPLHKTHPEKDGSKNKIENVDTSQGLSDVTHKNSFGNNNWLRFLKDQNAESTNSINIGMLKPHINLTEKRIPKKDDNPNSQNSANGKLTKVVALDCEMVGIGDHGRENMLARVSLVNGLGDCIYDKFVKPREHVVDYRTPVSGVRPDDVTNGEEFEVVQKEVSKILKNRILVGHALNSDFDVLFLSHPKRLIRDTSKFFRESGKGTPSLKKLTAKHLGVKIQEGEHNSVQDAKAAVQLYNMFRKEWEANLKSKFPNKSTVVKIPPEDLQDA